METTTGKRIVSKGEYVRLRVKRASLWLVGIGLALSTLLIGVVLLGCLVAAGACLWYFGLEGVGKALICLVSMGAAIALVRTIGDYGSHVLNTADAMNEVVPLTRANAAHLPATTSLVRASSEPLQAQEGVLLRAAVEGQETPSEQLVRAAELRK